MNGFVVGALFLFFGFAMIGLEIADKKRRLQAYTAHGDVKTTFGDLTVIWNRDGKIAILAYPKKSPNEIVYFALPADSRTAFEVEVDREELSYDGGP